MFEHTTKRKPTFGGEIECLIPSKRADRLPCGGHWESSRAHTESIPELEGWTIGTDSSITSNRRGYTPRECVSPVYTYPDDLPKFRAAVTYLRNIGAIVDSSCGGHIHIGVESILGSFPTQGRLLEFMLDTHNYVASIESAIFAYSGGELRAANTYCKQEKAKSEREVSINFLDNKERYQALNVVAYYAHKTLEFRLFAGSVDPDVWERNIMIAVMTCQRTARHCAIPDELTMDESGLRALEKLFYFPVDTFSLYRESDDDSADSEEVDEYDYTCSCCGDGIDEENAYTVDGDYDSVYCESCYESEFSYCECCDHTVPNDDICTANRRYTSRYSNQTRYEEITVCESCRDSEYTECAACHDYYPNDSMVETEECDSYCPNCWEDHTAICDHCELTHNTRNMRTIGDQSLCDECAEHAAVNPDTDQVVRWTFEYELQPMSTQIQTTRDGDEYTIIEYGNPFENVPCNWYARVVKRSDELIARQESRDLNIANQ